MLFVVSDATDAITEMDENNNVKSIPVYVNGTADTPADLAIVNINAPSSIKAGAEVTISYQLSNVGEFTANGTLNDVIYLSKNRTWDKDDVMVGVVSGKVNINPGEQATRSVTGRITNVPEGDYYVIVKTNSTKTIAESKEDNNTIVAASPSKLSFTTISLGSSASVNTSGYYKLEIPSGYDGKRSASISIIQKKPRQACMQHTNRCLPLPNMMLQPVLTKERSKNCCYQM